MAEVKNGKGAAKKAARRIDSGEADVERFVDLVLLHGYTQRRAWEEIHPASKAGRDAKDVMATKYAARPDVQARMAEVIEDMRKRHEEFRERLIEYHVRDIDSCVENEGNLTNCMEQVKSITKIMGYEKSTLNVEAKVGALDDGALADKLAFLMAKGVK